MTDSSIKLFTNIINQIPFNRIVGLSLESIEEDFITMRFTMTQDLIGNYLHGILHGGVISTVLDMAGGAAAIIAAVQKRPKQSPEQLAAHIGKSSTINLHIDFLKPGKGDHFIAKASVLQSGNKITFTRMELFNPSEELIAVGTGTYLIG